MTIRSSLMKYTTKLMTLMDTCQMLGWCQRLSRYTHEVPHVCCRCKGSTCIGGRGHQRGVCIVTVHTSTHTASGTSSTASSTAREGKDVPEAKSFVARTGHDSLSVGRHRQVQDYGNNETDSHKRQGTSSSNSNTYTYTNNFIIYLRTKRQRGIVMQIMSVLNSLDRWVCGWCDCLRTAHSVSWKSRELLHAGILPHDDLVEWIAVCRHDFVHGAWPHQIAHLCHERRHQEIRLKQMEQRTQRG